MLFLLIFIVSIVLSTFALGVVIWTILDTRKKHGSNPPSNE